MQRYDKVAISTQVMARQVENETVILNLASGTYFSLDPIGEHVWQLMSEGKSILEICDTMIDEYEVTRHALGRGVLALARKLVAQGLVILAPDMAG